MTRREAFIKACLELMGLPYLWDGKSFPSEPYNGRDCSGFVTERLHFIGGPDLRATHNTARMWADWAHVDSADVQPGDAALWGDGTTPHHVMVHLGVGQLLVGAAGGDATTTTQAEAIRRGARVQVWRGTDSMAGFMGFLRLPWVDDVPSRIS